MRMRILWGFVFALAAACGSPIRPGIRSVRDDFSGSSRRVSEFWLTTPHSQTGAYGRASRAGNDVGLSLTFNHDGAPVIAYCGSVRVRLGDAVVYEGEASVSVASRYGGVVETATIVLDAETVQRAGGRLTVAACSQMFEATSGAGEWLRELAQR